MKNVRKKNVDEIDTWSKYSLKLNGNSTLLVHCLIISDVPLNHKITSSSLAPPIFYATKKSAI